MDTDSDLTASPHQSQFGRWRGLCLVVVDCRILGTTEDQRLEASNSIQPRKAFTIAQLVSQYKTVTRAAFSIRGEGLEYELEVRMGILTSLSGIGVRVASAILALAEPERYCVIDFRGWRAVFDYEKSQFTIPDYKHYLRFVSGIARRLKWSPQEVDLAAAFTPSEAVVDTCIAVRAVAGGMRKHGLSHSSDA